MLWNPFCWVLGLEMSPVQALVLEPGNEPEGLQLGVSLVEKRMAEECYDITVPGNVGHT